MSENNLVENSKTKLSDLWRLEDWWTVWFGGILLFLTSVGLVKIVPKIGKWTNNPVEAIPSDLIIPLIILFVLITILLSIGIAVMKSEKLSRYIPGFITIFILSVVSYLFANQVVIKQYGLGYALWALVIGLIIANTVGTPGWLKAGARSELYIKTGLVLLGAEILFNNILKLGAPGIMVAWGVTPVVIIFMYLFGTRYLKMSSKRLTIVIATATSVCGVSAAIAAAAACRAKKEELTLAIGMTMIFTVIMMVGMPALIKLIGLDDRVGGAWLGGTIDATGAVVAAGAFFGRRSRKSGGYCKTDSECTYWNCCFFYCFLLGLICGTWKK